MTSRERILAAMRFEKVDRVPVAPFSLGRLDPDSAIAAELISKTDPFIEPPVLGNPFWSKICEPKVEKVGDTTTTRYATPAGEFVERYKTTYATSGCVEFFLKTPEDAERYLSIDYVSPEPDLTEWFRQKTKLGDEGLIVCAVCDPIMLPATFLDAETFCVWWADHRDLMIELTRVSAQRVNEWAHKLCRAGVDAFRIIGGEYASVQLGPKGFDALVLQQDKVLVEIMHSYGAMVHYHNHGPVMNFLSRFCEIGMDSIDPLEAPPWGDADLKAARAQCGNRLAFVGNLEDMEQINKLSTEEVCAIARERLEAAGDRGFMLSGTTSGTYTEHGARNFIAMVDVAKEFAAR